MSERNGACPTCRGYGEIILIDDFLENCGSCEGTGIWGGSFKPELAPVGRKPNFQTDPTTTNTTKPQMNRAGQAIRAAVLAVQKGLRSRGR